MPILGTVCPLFVMFIYFYLGQKLHTNLMELSDAIYQTGWHRYPSKVNCFILIMMMRSQQPYFLSAFGAIKLNFVNFVHVSNSFVDLIISELNSCAKLTKGHLSIRRVALDN